MLPKSRANHSDDHIKQDHAKNLSGGWSFLRKTFFYTSMQVHCTQVSLLSLCSQLHSSTAACTIWCYLQQAENKVCNLEDALSNTAQIVSTKHKRITRRAGLVVCPFGKFFLEELSSSFILEGLRDMEGNSRPLEITKIVYPVCDPFIGKQPLFSSGGFSLHSAV